jgi:hypothetical protein
MLALHDCHGYARPADLAAEMPSDQHVVILPEKGALYGYRSGKMVQFAKGFWFGRIRNSGTATGRLVPKGHAESAYP